MQIGVAVVDNKEVFYTEDNDKVEFEALFIDGVEQETIDIETANQVYSNGTKSVTYTKF